MKLEHKPDFAGKLSDLVQYIQENWANPEDRIPPSPPEPRIAEEAASDTVPEYTVEPIDRPPIPDWVSPGQGTPVKPREKIVGEEPYVSSTMDTPNVVDVLAHYLPFHFFKQGWGIYIRAQGVLSLASNLASGQSWANFQQMVDLS